MPGIRSDNELVLNKLRAMLIKYPGLRLCQLIGNAVPADVARKCKNDFYYVEDARLVDYLTIYDSKVQNAALKEAASRT